MLPGGDLVVPVRSDRIEVSVTESILAIGVFERIIRDDIWI